MKISPGTQYKLKIIAAGAAFYWATGSGWAFIGTLILWATFEPAK